MDVNPIVRYLNTLKKVGSIKGSELGFLSVYVFLSSIVENNDMPIDNEIVGDMDDMLHCIRNNSCLLMDVQDFKCMVQNAFEGLLLTAGRTVICTAAGTPIRLIS